jgi:hypothetical protein
MSGATQKKRIGEFMMEKGLIHREWVQPILDYSKAHSIRFGEAAVAMGYITERELRQVLIQPYQNQLFFHLDPQFFPMNTRELIPLKEIVRLGVLPLGVKSESHWFRKRSRLNLGVLNLTKTEALDWVKGHLKNVKSFKTFQVLPEEFLQTLELCYGVDRAELLKLETEQVDMNLGLYLQLERRRRPRTEQRKEE